jgi:hypothetical protein
MVLHNSERILCTEILFEFDGYDAKCRKVAKLLAQPLPG